MTIDEMFLRRAIVLGSALVYWTGVWIQARRVGKRIGRSPNVKPRGPKEKLLWAGWLVVIVGWMGQPILAGTSVYAPGLWLIPSLGHSLGLAVGIGMLVAGYVGTLWCYAVMGTAWRMGINRREKNTLVTQGPFRVVRHPIYLFQIVMLVGVILLLPTPLSAVILFVHLLCVLTKASDEESYLLAVHGQEYREYLSRTGRLFPKVLGPPSRTG